jgi:hypothetical protein
MHEAILRHDVSQELWPPELARELDVGAAPAIVGRDSELTWLRERWVSSQEPARWALGAAALGMVVD